MLKRRRSYKSSGKIKFGQLIEEQETLATFKQEQTVVTKKYGNDEYVGSMRNGKKNGQGKYTYSDGEEYFSTVSYHVC